ncbi:MAG: aminoacyl-tRNA hydrolase [Methylococcales symbiont of Iophon sp. n. MRB-2018]|nr:MAG: aminoacyl-tRNA hydrolase [Methylococcales symbiont of Iophon sp. n. MRB-2018]KAF3978858.1 MAG: aminoacyl-tRNA hydrolase [Methylococcales symbiont of Iophon sp. n. MRB-2018]
MIKLIVGLGNPGSQYEKTRHNAGFLFLDRLLESQFSEWLKESKFHGLVATVFIDRRKVILLKPQTFMNRSGLSVASVAKFYKMESEEILVIHDDLDFDVGVVKLKIGGGHAGHNGLRDIMSCLGDKDFCRARFGIGRPVLGKPVIDYVLTNFSKIDRQDLLSAFDLLDTQMDKIISGNMSFAMGKIN